MIKDIKKNREKLIRYMYEVNHISKESRVDCAKCRAFECFGYDPLGRVTGGEGFTFAGSNSFTEEAQELTSALEMTEDQWDAMEIYFEGWTHVNRLANPGKKTFAQIGDWLQEIPGWPKVL